MSTSATSAASASSSQQRVEGGEADDRENYTTTLLPKVHAKYVESLRNDSIEAKKLSHWMSTHLRVSGMYWGLSALRLMNIPEKSKEDTESIIKFVLSCRNVDGGFAGHGGHDSHLLYTLSAVQVLAMLNHEMSTEEKLGTAKWVAGLQQPDGSFVGDRYKEVDTRFSYSALNCLALLGHLPSSSPSSSSPQQQEENEGEKAKETTSLIDLDAAVKFVLRCQNWDGGFGVSPSAESHAGQIFCCVGALSIANRLGSLDAADRVAWWLAERQLPSGGLNGRPEKKADVCYSWWVLSSLAMLGRVHWIDKEALSKFILLCQDAEDGGISDKPGNQPDVYHTFFGVAGLSLLGWNGPGADNLGKIDPTFAMPPDVLERLGIEKRGLEKQK